MEYTRARRSDQNGPFWVDGLGSGPCSSHLLVQSSNGSFQLFDADANALSPLRLAFRSHQPFQAFIMQDGNLRIVECGKVEERSGLHPLQWHTIDPATGATMSSQPILKLVSDEMLPVVHCGAARAVGMHDARCIAFMDAETLQQLGESSVLPPDLDASKGIVSIQSMLWSEHGTMLAVGLQSSASNTSASGSLTGNAADFVSGIRIYSTLSGQCLQSMQLQASSAVISWSSSLDKLLVDCARPSRFPQADDGSAWLIDPALDRSGGSQVSLLQSCHCCLLQWTPGGDLLVLKCWDHASQTLEFFDPQTMRVILTLDEHECTNHLHNVSWAPGAWLPATAPCIAIQNRSIQAYMQDSSRVADIRKVNGEWQGSFQRLRMHHRYGDGLISPAGNVVVFPHPEPTSSSRSAHAAGSIFHFDLNSHCMHDLSPATHTRPKLPKAPTAARMSAPCPRRHEAFVQWADIPRGWPQVYACSSLSHHALKHEVEVPDAVKLIDATKHRVLASWKVCELLRQAAGRARSGAPACQDVKELVWSPSGNHLCVTCEGWILILTFGKP